MAVSYPLIDTNGHRLEASAAEGFRKLEAAAKHEGYGIIVHNSLRDYAKQEVLFREYQKRLEEWRSNSQASHKPSPVAAPGTSEHEVGIAVDLDTQSEEDFIIWLAKSAAVYRWYFTASGERWHIAFYPFGPPAKLLERHHANIKLILE